MRQSGGRVFLASGECSRQRLHSDFKKAPQNEKNEEQLNSTEGESHAAGYFGMVSGRSEMLL